MRRNVNPQNSVPRNRPVEVTLGNPSGGLGKTALSATSPKGSPPTPLIDKSIGCPGEMKSTLPHISICICTYKRASFLERLLHKLQNLTTDDLFTYSLVVVDNDHMASARGVADAFKAVFGSGLTYVIEPEQNIALARNKAVSNATGDYIAFIDDDEWPSNDWLVNLFKTLPAYQASGVLGPVLPHFDFPPPPWILKGRFYDRPTHETGTLLSWTHTRTGNVLLRREVFNGVTFRPAFGSGGEDRDFFRELINRGHRIVWCAEATVYESVPPERWKMSFMLRRALLRGQIPCYRRLDFLKSIVAIPIYTVSLPVFFLLGRHLFMKYLIKNFDHVGRLLALCGIDVVKEKYVMH